MVQSYVNDTLIEILKTATIDDGAGGTESLFIIDTSGNYLDINYEYEAFNRPNSGVWYELHFLPLQPKQVELGHSAQNRWKGIFQINVCVLKNIRSITSNMGVQEYFDTAYESIAEVMKRGVIKNRVHITGVGKSSAIDNSDYYSMPISVNWYANLPN